MALHLSQSFLAKASSYNTITLWQQTATLGCILTACNA